MRGGACILYGGGFFISFFLERDGGKNGGLKKKKKGKKVEKPQRSRRRGASLSHLDGGVLPLIETRRTRLRRGPLHDHHRTQLQALRVVGRDRRRTLIYKLLVWGRRRKGRKEKNVQGKAESRI